MSLSSRLSLFAVAGLLLTSCATIDPWTITVGSQSTTYRCRDTMIPVPAATSCDAARVIAQEVFASARGCINACPNAILETTKTTCTRWRGRYRVKLPWRCRRVAFDTMPRGRDCDEAAVTKGDAVIIPPKAKEVGDQEDVDEDRGPLSSLYPNVDTSTDAFYPLPCEPSIGGTLPPDQPPTQDELDAEAAVQGFEQGKAQQIKQQLQAQPMAAISPIPPLPGSDCVILRPQPHGVPCDSPLLLLSDQPFEGRDIIYVHGLQGEHLQDRLFNPPPTTHGSSARWPQDATEFLDVSGYYRNHARAYWQPHIRENLFDPISPLYPNAGWEWWSGAAAPSYRPKANRYLIVAWSSNQTLEYAQHTLLTQIQLAMTQDKNVVTPPTYPSSSFIRPFCANGCILISHSTGGLVVDSAMGLARNGFYGPGGVQITQKMAAHVSLEGAISGSRIASVALTVGLAVAPIVQGSNVLCGVIDWLFKTNNACNADTTFVASSILRDLVPVIAQGVWGFAVDATPVPTVTVAGGHPLGEAFGIAKPILPGLDDSVVSMNSACGNPNLVLTGVLAPSGFAVLNPVRAFDFSTNAGRLARGAKNWLSHKNLRAVPPLLNYLAAGCTPYVSPTGMVMPALAAFRNTPWDSRRRYRNHYSMLHGSIDHPYDPFGPWPSAGGQSAAATREYQIALTNNVEESSAVTDLGIYATIDGNGTHLLHPSFANIREVVRGRRIRFRLFGQNRTIWIWKRTYHLLDKWEVKQSSHYVYEFVARR